MENTDQDDVIDSEPLPVNVPDEWVDPWKVLVVDDDADVHESTVFGLRGLDIEGRSLKLLHAYSAQEAIQTLEREPDIAVVLLDVVMEADDAGLVAVKAIREDLGMTNVRIILRTGQPGQAPEVETIRRYDINDYKTKSELSRARLYTALTAAIRAFDQLRRLEASRKGLEQIIAGSHQFIAEQGIRAFAEGVITQIAGLVGIEPEGLVCASAGTAAARAGSPYEVIAAAGAFARFIHCGIAEIDDPHIVDSLTQCLSQRQNLVGQRSITLFFSGHDGHDFAAFVYARQPLREVDTHLLQVFCTNLSLGAANVALVSRLKEQAFVDQLLGLPNRAAFVQHIDSAVKGDAANDCVVGLLDIDHFAETNDMFGHVYGDLLLAAIARRLSEALSGQCVLGRVAGDMFGVFGPGQWVNPAFFSTLFEEPFEIEDVLRPVSLSQGFARCGGEALGGIDLFKNASIALKRAKASGQAKSEYYTEEVGLQTRERTRLLHGLQKSFKHHRLTVVYQPQVSLATGRTVGIEALLRWRTEDGSFVPPDQFIPVAEQSGLIVPIGAWVLRTALVDQGRLRAQGAPIRVAVNVSSIQFAQPQFLSVLDEALRDTAVPPECLELEITESVAMIGMERVQALLNQIRARRIAIAIDDFGTGFSSLSYLDRLPADRLKIDRTFVAALDSGRAGARIAEMIVPLGQRLGMKVLAEGVENEAQARMLAKLGCDEAQGYLYAKPMAFEQLVGWLAEGGRSGA